MNLALGKHTLGLQRLTEAFPSLVPQPRVPLQLHRLSHFVCFFVFGLFLFVFWLHHMARVIFVPRLGIEPKSAASEAQSLHHWATRKVPGSVIFE